MPSKSSVKISPGNLSERKKNINTSHKKVHHIICETEANAPSVIKIVPQMAYGRSFAGQLSIAIMPKTSAIAAATVAHFIPLKNSVRLFFFV